MFILAETLFQGAEERFSPAKASRSQRDFLGLLFGQAVEDALTLSPSATFPLSPPIPWKSEEAASFCSIPKHPPLRKLNIMLTLKDKYLKNFCCWAQNIFPRVYSELRGNTLITDTPDLHAPTLRSSASLTHYFPSHTSVSSVALMIMFSLILFDYLKFLIL